MLLWDPVKRPSCQNCLRYPYFHVGQNLPKPSSDWHATQQKQHVPTKDDATERFSLKRERQSAKETDFTHKIAEKSIKDPTAPMPVANAKPSVVSKFSSTSGRKRWGGNATVKDSTDEFEALLNEIEPSYKPKVTENIRV